MTLTRSTFRRGAPRTTAIVAAGALLLGACSGSDSDGVAIDVTTTTESVETTTTAAPTTTETSAPETTVQQTVSGPRFPLSGMPISDGDEAADRPALLVKIDNHPSARPQTGIDLADIVFEYRAEGVTRFAAVFHSQSPEVIGPVRSSRSADFDLLRGLNSPLYASSGANDNVAAGLRELPIYSVTAMSESIYFRNGSRPAPHNLYAESARLFGLAPAEAEPPFAWFRYRAEDQELPAAAVPLTEAVTIRYRDAPLVTHTWDDAAGGWGRTQDSQPHTNADGVQLTPENVVIMVSTYVRSGADANSPELVSVGSGDLMVLTDGHLIEGTWQRLAADQAPILTDSSGAEILLTPGRTWVLWPEAGNVTLPAG